MLRPIFIKQPIACYIYEANIISELEMRFEHDDIDEEQLNEAKNTLILSDEGKRYIDKLLLTKTESLFP